MLAFALIHFGRTYNKNVKLSPKGLGKFVESLLTF